MRFNDHWGLEDKHAFLSPSQHSWVNYDLAKLEERYSRHEAAKMGTRLHAFAEECILLGRKQPRTKDTLNMYVNDAIKYNLRPEQILYYSPNCFGTADAIGFEHGLLRIHDLKTGVTPASMVQLEIYAALFCLEYDVRPGDVDMELRIYQSNEVRVEEPEVGQIAFIIDRIVSFDAYLMELQDSDLFG